MCSDQPTRTDGTANGPILGNLETAMSTEHDLFLMEERFWTGGSEVYEQHCDSRCLVVFAAMAAVMSREDIARIAERGRWTDVNIRPLGFLEISDTAAEIAYDCTARRRDGRHYHARVTSTYVRRADGWKLAGHHQSE
jgi:hypothetical protein